MVWWSWQLPATTVMLTRIYPAACTHSVTGQSTVIAVAASDDSDNRTDFTNYSVACDDWVSMAAPGELIVGILPFDHCGLGRAH